VWSPRFGWKFSKYLFWPRHVNLLLFIKRFVKISDLFQSSTQSNLQKDITWPNFFGKFIHKWNKACVDSKLCPRKLNILMKTRWILKSLFAFNIKREVCDVLKSILFFYKRFEEKKHVVFDVNLRFKSFHLIYIFIGHGDVWISLRNIINDLYILCFWSVINICI
jgi:hypothetical protein